MARLRRPLQLLLLLLVASIVVVQGGITAGPDNHGWQTCGLLSFCIVHKSCFGDQSKNAKGWTILKNTGTYPSGTSDPADYADSTCERYIVMSPVKGARQVEVRMRNRINSASVDAEFRFKKKGIVQPSMKCLSNRLSAQEFEPAGFAYQEQFNTDRPHECNFRIETIQRADIREKITDFTTGFEISSADDGDGQSLAVTYSVDGVDLKKLRMLCEGKTIDKVLSQFIYSMDPADEELTNSTYGELVPLSAKYCHQSGTQCRTLDDDAKVQCPPGFPMKHKQGLEGTWDYVEDGLVCRKGQLTHAKQENRVIESDDGIKCSRKKCTTCTDPKINHQKEANFETPKFETDPGENKCRALKCPNLGNMIVTLKGQKGPIIHKKGVLECSASNGAMTEQNWDAVEGEKRGELIDAICTNDVYCTRMHPIASAKCTEGDTQCREAFISDNYVSTGPCPGNFTLQYIANGTGNEVFLSRFECRKADGIWFAWNKEGSKVDILDGSTLVCKRNPKDELIDRREEPFLGSAAFWVFLGGIAIIVVAIVVVGGFLIMKSKKDKERKRKAMASVSQTFKEPKKGKKGSRKDERKKRQKSVVNSVTGDTDSGPQSQSGGGSTAGSVPIAPPSKLLSPSGVSKPDKGCAVLDLATGESKNMHWTNHTGDGPPTQRQPESTNYATSHSRQDDVQSAIKFAPEEQAALKKAGLDAQRKKKKEKSRQKSIEYNLGYPKPVQNDGSKRTKNWMTSDVPAVEESKGADESMTMK